MRLGRQPLADAEDVDAVAVVAPDDGGRVVALVAHDDRGVDVQDPRALLGHRHEDALGAHLRGDERGHAPQRALLGGQPADLRELGPGVAFQRVVVLARLAIGEVDPRRDERLGHAVGAGHGLVGPRDEAPPAVLAEPVADLRGRRAGRPDVLEELAEGLALLGRDDEVARVATDQLVAAKARGPLARLVEEQDPPLPIEHADERLRGLGEGPGEGLADRELRRLARLIHRGCAEGSCATGPIAGLSRKLVDGGSCIAYGLRGKPSLGAPNTMQRRELETAAAHYSYLRGLLYLPVGGLFVLAALGNWQVGPFRHAWVFLLVALAIAAVAVAINRYYNEVYGRLTPSTAPAGPREHRARPRGGADARRRDAPAQPRELVAGPAGERHRGLLRARDARDLRDRGRPQDPPRRHLGHGAGGRRAAGLGRP